MKVADIHAHAFPDKIAAKAAQSISEFYDYGDKGFACPVASAENLAALEREAGVSRFVMCNSATNAHQNAGGRQLAVLGRRPCFW